VGVERNRSEFTIGASDGENTSDSIVGGISFNGERSVGDPMSKDRSGGKGLLQGVESGATLIGEIPRRSLVGQTGERNNNVGVIMNEATVEVGKSEERLDVLDFAGFWPVLNSLDLLWRHGEALWR